MATDKTVTVKMHGRNWTVPAGLSTKETVEFIKGVIAGDHVEPEPNPYVEPKQDVVVDGTLETKPMDELMTQIGGTLEGGEE